MTTKSFIWHPKVFATDDWLDLMQVAGAAPFTSTIVRLTNHAYTTMNATRLAAQTHSHRVSSRASADRSKADEP